MDLLDVEQVGELLFHLLRILKSDEQPVFFQIVVNLIHQDVAELLRKVEERQPAQYAVKRFDSFFLKDGVQLARFPVTGEFRIPRGNLRLKMGFFFEQQHLRSRLSRLLNISGQRPGAAAELGHILDMIPGNGLNHLFA